MYVVFLLITGISYRGGTIHIQPSLTEKLFWIKVPIEFLHGDPIFSIVHSIKTYNDSFDFRLYVAKNEYNQHLKM